MQAMPAVKAESVVDFLNESWPFEVLISEDNLTGTIPTDIYSNYYCKSFNGGNAPCTFGGMTKI
jgi:hypothetical protein